MHDNDSSGPTSQGVARRVARPAPPVLGAAILADISFSMDNRDGRARGGELLPPRRIDRLAKVLDYLLTRVRMQKLICFHDHPIEVPLSGRIVLPEPEGSTNLALALDHVAGLQPLPSQLFVLSDGMPNDVVMALEYARRLKPMVLNCYYIGPEAWDPGLAFMASLAACGGPGGRSGHFDLLDPVLLGSELHRLLLAGPKQ